MQTSPLKTNRKRQRPFVRPGHICDYLRFPRLPFACSNLPTTKTFSSISSANSSPLTLHSPRSPHHRQLDRLCPALSRPDHPPGHRRSRRQSSPGDVPHRRGPLVPRQGAQPAPHSQSVAAQPGLRHGCQQIAATGFMDKDTAYTAGVLHDIGRLALAVLRPAITRRCSPDTAALGRASCPGDRLFGCDHCEAGSHLVLIGTCRAISNPLSPTIIPRRTDGAWSMVELIKVSCRLADTVGFKAFPGCEVTPLGELVQELPPRERSGFPKALKRSQLMWPLKSKLSRPCEMRMGERPYRVLPTAVAISLNSPISSSN